jgi:hypothetical protein
MDYYKKQVEKKRKGKKSSKFSSSFDYTGKVKIDMPSPLADTSFDQISKTIDSWHPDKLVILIYPTVQDFTQQRVTPGLHPPFHMAFMEIFNFRACVPYTGEWWEYCNLLSHELTHAWQFHYLDEYDKIYRKVTKNYRAKDIRRLFPLWSIEGWAEHSAGIFQKENPEYYRCIWENAIRQTVCGMDERGLPKLDEMRGEVYYLGRNFKDWMVERYENQKFVELNQMTILEQSFSKAWSKIFLETNAESEDEWQEYLKKKYFRVVYEDSGQYNYLRIPMPKVDGYAGYDNHRIIYYARDEKCGNNIVVTDLNHKKTIKLHRQFEKQSLWYDMGDQPAIKDSLAAFTINCAGQDELHVYRIIAKKHQWKSKHTDSKSKTSDTWTINAKKIKVLRHKTVIIVNQPEIVDSETIAFEGTDINGDVNLYQWNFQTDELIKITDDFYFESCPKKFFDKYLFISNRHDPYSYGLYQINPRTGETVEIFHRKNCYVDQICANERDSLVAFRTVTFDHSPQVYIWNAKTNQITLVYSDYLGVRQILGWRLEGDQLLIIPSLPKGKEKGKVKGLFINDLNLAENLLNKSFAAQLRKAYPVSWQLPYLDYCLVRYKAKADKKLRYAMVTPNNWFVITDATGEYQASFNASGGLSNGKLMYLLWGHYNDLSHRLTKFYRFDSYHLYNRFYNPKYCTKNKFYVNDLVTRDWVPAKFRVQAYYPINLEWGIGASISPGYLSRTYNKWGSRGWSWEIGHIGTPTVGTTIFLTKDAVFRDWWGARHGTYLFAGFYGVYGKIDNKIQPIESYSVFDFRHYLRLGSSRIYWANRLFALKCFGYDQYIYQLDDLYRGKIDYDLISGARQNRGTATVLFQSELRFPLFNWIAFQPAVVSPRSNKGIFGFAIEGALFWYGGDIWFHDLDQMHWFNRAGAKIKIKLNPVLSVNIEHYKYIHDWEDLNLDDRKWGWSIGYDF